MKFEKTVHGEFFYSLAITLFFSYYQKLSLCVTAPLGRMVDSATGRCDKSIDDRMSLKKETCAGSREVLTVGKAIRVRVAHTEVEGVIVELSTQ